MKVTETELKGCLIIEPKVFKDERGYFFESFNEKYFEDKTGLKTLFVQDNEALSHRGTIRGLHFQKGIHAQAKLLRVVKGEILDVVVDLREDSETYGEVYKIILSENNKKQLYVPKGFAHGYSVLENNTILHYKCDAPYFPESESGIHYLDSNLNIDWLLKKEEHIVSEKDQNLPNLDEIVGKV